MMDRLQDLLDRIKGLDIPDDDRDHMIRHVTCLMYKDYERRKKVKLLKTAMDDLRLNVTYLVFDLEATRQELDELKP